MKFNTNKCARYGHPELVFNCDVKRVPEIDVLQFIDYLENEVKNGVIFKEGETMQVGWMITEFSQDSDTKEKLHILEPNMIDIPMVFIESLTSTLLHLRIQKDVVESCNLELCFPNIYESVYVIQDYKFLNDMYLQRLSPEENFSGWFVHSTIDEGDTINFDRCKLISLYELACNRPDLIKFLALPQGCEVHIVKSGAIHILESGKEIKFQPNSFLDQLNKMKLDQ